MNNQLKKAIPSILSVMACIGVGVTAYLTGKAAVKSHDILEEKRSKGEEMTKKEEIQTVAKEYVWAGVSGGATIGCIIASKAIDGKTIAGLTGALYLGAKKFSDYRKQIVEDYGIAEEQQIMEKVQEREKREEEILETICDTGDTPGDELVRYYDSYANEFFWTTPYKFLKAEYDLNEHFQIETLIPITDFHDILCINHHPELEGTGWDMRCVGACTTMAPWISITTVDHVDDNGEPYKAIVYLTTPCDVVDQGCWGD